MSGVTIAITSRDSANKGANFIRTSDIHKLFNILQLKVNPINNHNNRKNRSLTF